MSGGFHGCFNWFFDICSSIISAKYRKKHGSEVECDEKQEIIRYRGYRYGALTGLTLNWIFAWLLIVFPDVPFDASIIMIAITLIAALVSGLYSIFKGVYFGMSKRGKETTLLIAVFGLINLISGIMQIVNEGLLPDGKLTLPNSVNLLVGVFMLIIAIAILLQNYRERKESE